MSVTALKNHRNVKASPENDPLRTALTVAIAAEGKVRVEIDACRDAIATARDMVRHAEENLQAAKDGVVLARDAHAVRLANAAASGAAPSGSPMRAARVRELDARDDLDAARSALEKLMTRIRELEDGLSTATNEVLVARNAMLLPLAEVFLRHARAGWENFMRYKQIVQALVEDENRPRFNDPTLSLLAERKRCTLLDDVRQQIDQLGPPHGRWVEATEICNAWRQFRAALLNDPDAAEPPPSSSAQIN